MKIPDWLQQKHEAVLIRISVRPSSKKTELLSIRPSSLVITVKAPRDQGKANMELISFLSSLFKKEEHDIVICQGHTSATKVVLLKNCTMCHVMSIIYPDVKDSL